MCPKSAKTENLYIEMHLGNCIFRKKEPIEFYYTTYGIMINGWFLEYTWESGIEALNYIAEQVREEDIPTIKEK